MGEKYISKIAQGDNTYYIKDLNAVSGSSLTSNNIIIGGGNSSVSASGKSIETSLTANSDNAVPTSKAVATYVATNIANATRYKGGFNANSSDGTIDGGNTTLKSVKEVIGDMYTVTTAGTFLGQSLEVGDSIIFKADVAAGTSPIAPNVVFVEGTTSVSVPSTTPTLSWGQTSTIGTVEGVDLKITMPSAISVMGASGSNHASGLVPDPGSTEGTTKYLREDGTWVVPPDTTYSVMGASGNNHASGLVPDPGQTSGTSRYLREDGTWQQTPGGKHYYGTCNTESQIVTKVVQTHNQDFQLSAGNIVTVTFNADNSSIGTMLNIDNTGEYYIVYGGEALTTESKILGGKSGGTITYMCVSDIDTQNNQTFYYIPISSGDLISELMSQNFSYIYTLSNIPNLSKLLYASITTNQSSVNVLNNYIPEGQEVHVIIRAGSSDVTITLPTGGKYINCSSDSVLNVKANKYAEINFVSGGSFIFVRGVA